MKGFFQKHHRLIFYAAWFIFGLIQSRFTELQDDEAYYWVYSKFPDWGYFDHPPMIAILVKMGYAIFHNELGVRLFPLLLNLFSLVFLEKLTSPKNPFLFYAIILSLSILQLAGFMAAPDTPLLFFTVLFFWCYQKFISNLSLANTLLLGVSVALLFYCKYHAVFIVFFSLLSNPRLFTRYQTYIAGILVLLLFAPHLWWQYQHNWVSLHYHLFEGHIRAYKISLTLNYLLGQVLLVGPFAGFILLPAAFSCKPVTGTERAMRFSLIGIYVFFLLVSFRGKVETNWTSPAMASVIVLSHRFLENEIKWRKLLFKLLLPSLILVCFARVVMLFDILPVDKIRFRFHSWSAWPRQMKEITKGLPVVFNNSYQRASKYWFYTGQPTYSLNYYHARMNNYNFWPLEDSMLGKPVYYLDVRSPFAFPDSLRYPLGYIVYKYDSSYASFAKINIETVPERFVLQEGTELTMRCRFRIPPLYSSYINTHGIKNDTIRIGFFNSLRWVRDIFTPLTLKQINEAREVELRISPGLPRGKYYMRFAINTGIYTPTHNSDKIELVVK